MFACLRVCACVFSVFVYDLRVDVSYILHIQVTDFLILLPGVNITQCFSFLTLNRVEQGGSKIKSILVF